MNEIEYQGERQLDIVDKHGKTNLNKIEKQLKKQLVKSCKGRRIKKKCVVERRSLW